MATKIQLETRIRELERRLENDEQDMVEVCDRIEKLEQKNNDICGVIYDMTWPHNRAKIRERIHYARIDTGDTEAQDDETPVSNDGSDVRVDADCNADSTGDVSGVDVDAIMGEIAKQFDIECECGRLHDYDVEDVQIRVAPIIERLVGERDEYKKSSNDWARHFKLERTARISAEAEVAQDVKLLMSFVDYLNVDDVPEGLDPTFYHTLTQYGDEKLAEQVKAIKRKYGIVRQMKKEE